MIKVGSKEVKKKKKLPFTCEVAVPKLHLQHPHQGGQVVRQVVVRHRTLEQLPARMQQRSRSADHEAWVTGHGHGSWVMGHRLIERETGGKGTTWPCYGAAQHA